MAGPHGQPGGADHRFPLKPPAPTDAPRCSRRGDFRRDHRDLAEAAAAHEGLAAFLRSRELLSPAADCLRRAVALDPTRASAHDELGRVLNNLRHLPEAEACFRELVRLRPGFAPGHARLGHVLRAQGRMAEAEACFREAVRLDPDLTRAWLDLGTVLLATDRTEEAVDAFERAVALAPDDATARFDLALAWERAGRPGRALEQLRAAHRLAPQDPDIAVNLAGALQNEGEVEEALRILRALLATHPGHPAAVVAVAANLDVLGRYREGLTWVEEHAALLTTEPEMRIIRAQLLLHLGRGQEAVTDLASLVDEPGTSREQRPLALFTLGEIHDAAGEFSLAWEAYAAANQLRAGRFDATAYRHRVEEIVTTLDRGFLERLAGAGRDDRRPVFIVGMPRSGTSLVEQILGSHPEVHAAGERAEFGSLAQGFLRTAAAVSDAAQTRRAVTEMADRYLAVLEGLTGGEASRITDKMWQNFEWLGLIQLAFPKATIIQCLRHPLDIALSCYFQSFGRLGVPFSYDLADIAAVLRSYHRLMEHWRTVLDIPIHRVVYEELVVDQEGETRRLLEAAGLEWDPACLDFHRHARVTTTASNAQVRRPIYRDRTQRWRNYAEWLPAELMALAEELGNL